MAQFKAISTDMSAGLLSPMLRGRIDLDKYRSGLQKSRNFLPTIQGPVSFREGFKFLTELPTGTLKLIPFQVGDTNRYVVILSAGKLSVYDPEGSLVIELTNSPYQDNEINDVRYHTSIDQIVFTHGNYPPYQLNSNVVYTSVTLQDSGNFTLLSSDGFALQATSNNVEQPDAWSFGLVNFLSQPYEESLTGSYKLQLSEEKEVVKLVSTNSSDFSWSTSVINNMHTVSGAKYVEYNINNQWAFARVLTTTTNNEGVSAPENPTGTSCYVDPVDRVLNVEDKTTKLAPIYGNTTWAKYSIRRNPNGVKSGKLDVRSDTVLWQSNHVGAWVRCSANNHFDKVCPAGPASHTGADGRTRWVRIDKLKGLEDHPTEYLVGHGQCCYAVAYRVGDTYQILDWGSLSGTDKGFRWYGSNADRKASRNLTSEVLQNRTTTRFIANSNQQFVNFRVPSDAGRIIIGNLSSNVQFDVIESSKWLTVGESYEVRSTTGTVSLFDLISDPDEQATHIVRVTSNKPLFELGRDTDRFLMAKLSTDWVTLQLRDIISDKEAVCNVLSTIPNEQTGDIYGMQNGGSVSEIRLGAWYDNNYPWAVSFYERRQVYGGSNAQPNMVWFSKINDSTDFRTIESDGTVLDTTGITYPLGSSSSVIRWFLSSTSLLIGTEAGEWQIRPNELQAAVTSTNIRINEETAIGSIIPASRIGPSTFFTNSSGRIFSEFIYELQQQRFVTKTTTKLVPDLFLDSGIKAFAYQQSPRSVIWLISDSGELFSLTYRQEDDYYAWSTHSTPNGLFTDLVVLPKSSPVNKEDQLFVVVERNGVRTMEALSEVFTDSESDNFKPNLSYLDSSVRHPSIGYLAQETIPVPTHLQGLPKIDTIIDGVYLGELDVVNNLVQLPDGISCNKYALIGIKYTGEIQPMPLAYEGFGGTIYGEDIRVAEIKLYLYKSMGYDIQLGDNIDSFRGMESASTTMGESPALYTGFTDRQLLTSSVYNTSNDPIIRQLEPYPLNIVSINYKISVN